MRTGALVAVVLAASFAVSACGDDEEDGRTSSSTQTTSSSSSSASGSGGAGGGDGGSGGQASSCGDGVVAESEGCDDGNTDADDGCDADCAVEAGYECSGEPSQCAPVCGDSVIAGDEACDDGNETARDGCSDACAIEAGWSCDGEPSVCAPGCGDGIVAGPEGCDDGNLDANDGCGTACEIELGWTCEGEPSACSTTCGDGVIAGVEVCDDGGTAAGDGCDDACAVEAGWDCTGEPSVCSTSCGDSVIAGDETCDDGDALGGDGCDELCLVEAGWDCIGEPSVCDTLCGDGVVAGAETCDDGGTAAGDGCDAACSVETGYECSGEPSTCATICGDGLIVGFEACDDSGTAVGDGCDDVCAIETGWACTGEPSACSEICGDGMIVGAETCDDSDANDGDGCSNVCLVEAGWGCTGVPSVCASVCGDGLLVPGEACDDGDTTAGDGCSATCTVETGYACIGAPSVCATVCGDNIIAGTEVCDDGNTTSGDGCSVICTIESATCGNGTLQALEQCDDGNLSGGDGCDAGCITEPGFTCTGTPSFCCVQEAEPNDGLATATPAVLGAVACGSINPSSDQDYFSFTLTMTSDLYIETFGPTGPGVCPSGFDTHIYLASSNGTAIFDDDDDGLNLCSKIDATKDALAQNLPPGTYYVLVEEDGNNAVLSNYTLLIEAAACGDGIINGSEECDGGASCDASCNVVTPAAGESWQTATPLGACPLTFTSDAQLDPPACFPLSGAIQWYSYTSTQGLATVTANAPGPVVVLGSTGQVIQCSTDAAAAPITALVGAGGGTIYIGVHTESAVSCVTVTEAPYTGVGTTLTNLNVTFPTSATTSYELAVGPTDLYLSGSTKVFSFAKTLNAVADEHGAADNITSAHLGYDIHFAAGQLFSVDTIATATTSRLFRIFNASTNLWFPVTWDLTPTYTDSTDTITYDGSNLLSATSRTGQVDFYSYSVVAAGTPVFLGNNAVTGSVYGMAADATYFYVAGTTSANGEGVYRISRTNISGPPTKIATLDTSALHNSVAVDNTTSANHLYVREYGGDIHVIANPGGAASHLGVLSTLGDTSDYAMGYDAADNSIYFYETESLTTGRVWKLQ